jgi:hypothetical protein
MTLIGQVIRQLLTGNLNKNMIFYLYSPLNLFIERNVGSNR